jgi:hypothetical protein
MKQILFLMSFLFFLGCNTKDSQKEADKKEKSKLRREFIFQFDENSISPYIDLLNVLKIIGGEDKYNGNICDVFPEGQLYLIDYESANLFDLLKIENNNEIELDYSMIDDGELVEADCFLLVISNGCRYIPYKKKCHVRLTALKIFSYEDAMKIGYAELNNYIKKIIMR